MPTERFCAHETVFPRGAAVGPLTGLRFGAKDNFVRRGTIGPAVETRIGCAQHDPRRRDRAGSEGAPRRRGRAGGQDADGRAGLQHQRGEPLLRDSRESEEPGPHPGRLVQRVGRGGSRRPRRFRRGQRHGGIGRAPASFCGIHGLRPSHGAVAIQGCMPLAPSYDNVGWFARDLEVLARVGQVLLPAQAAARPRAC